MQRAVAVDDARSGEAVLLGVADVLGNVLGLLRRDVALLEVVRHVVPIARHLNLLLRLQCLRAGEHLLVALHRGLNAELHREVRLAASVRAHYQQLGYSMLKTQPLAHRLGKLFRSPVLVSEQRLSYPPDRRPLVAAPAGIADERLGDIPDRRLVAEVVWVAAALFDLTQAQLLQEVLGLVRLNPLGSGECDDLLDRRRLHHRVSHCSPVPSSGFFGS